MRNIYKRTKIGEISQGAIFNGAIADKYENESIFGIIISPRCDIEHAKISVVHFLPVIPLSLWINHEFSILFLDKLKRQLDNTCKTIFINNKLSANVFNYLSYSVIKESFVNSFKGKEQTKIDDLLTDLESILELLRESPVRIRTNHSLLVKHQKIAKTILTCIIRNQDSDFYLIESWNNNEKFYIIKLREIRRLNFKLAIEIAKGLESRKYNPDFLLSNDLNQRKSDDLIVYHTILNSPFMEHLIQVFFSNFGRIGIDDHNEESINEFYNEIIQNDTSSSNL